MPPGVPRAIADADFPMSSMLVQIITNKGGVHLRFASHDSPQERLIKDAPKISFGRDIAKPAAIISIRARCNQGWEITEFRAFMHLMHEPAVVHARFLRVR